MAALGLFRHEFPGKAVYRQAVMLPLVFPQIVNGIGLLVLFSTLRFPGSFGRLLIGHVLISLPYVILTVGANLEVYERELEEAAVGLGAGPAQVLFRITLPLIKSGIISGSIFSFIVSFTHFTVSFFLYSGEYKPLPMWLYEYMEYFVDPTMAAISTLLILLTLLVAFVLERIVGVSRLFGLR
jgi:putative spermidine/putrescine transport system permease protein